MSKRLSVVLPVLVAASFFITCAPPPAPAEECVTPEEHAEAPPAKAERFYLSSKPNPDDDWCQSCVMSLKGFISCQKVYQTPGGASRDELKKQAHEKACLDAGYTSKDCPDKALLTTNCKGDPLSPERFLDAAKRLKVFVPNPNAPANQTESPALAPKAEDAK